MCTNDFLIKSFSRQPQECSHPAEKETVHNTAHTNSNVACETSSAQMEIRNKSEEEEEEEEVEVPSGSDFLYHSLPIRFIFFTMR